MADRDWVAEARDLLAQAVGTNDNAPVTADDPYDHQRRRFLDRLHGYLAAQDDGVAAAFGDELHRLFGTDRPEALDRHQLAEMLAGFDRLMRAARLLAATPAGTR